MSNQTSSSLFIYTALECEAKPFLKLFELKKESNNHPFSIYRNNNTFLTISGVGKIAMAAAVSYTQAIYQNYSSPVIVNVGIAGCKSQSIGDIFLATKIVDKDSGKRFYPQLIGRSWPKTNKVQTSSAPCTEYSSEHMNDMEASAFYETAVKFSSSELIHCIKVISDNGLSSIKEIHPKLVTKWISNHLIQIEQLLNHWSSLQQSISFNELKDFNKITSQWHFTVSGQIKLRNLLLRWQVLSKGSWLSNNRTNLQSSKDVLRKLEVDTNNLKIQL